MYLLIPDSNFTSMQGSSSPNRYSIFSFEKITTLAFLITLLVIIGRPSSFAQEKSNFAHLEKTFERTSVIKEDSLGYIWISSNDGLYKYDGYGYQFISLKTIFGDSLVNEQSIFFNKDSNSNFWVGTSSSELAKVDINGKSEIYSGEFSKLSPRIKITSLASEKDIVYFGTNVGIILQYDYQTNSLSQIGVLPQYNNSSRYIYDLLITDKETLWLSTSNSKIFRFGRKGGKLTELSTPFNSKIYDLINIESDKNGKLWIATEQQGLISYDLENEKFENHQLPSKLNMRHPMIRSIFIDSSNMIWLGMDGDGLYQYDPKTKKLNIYPAKNNDPFSLSSGTVRNISEDFHGNIWVVCKWGYIDILPNYRNHVDYFSGSEDGSPTSVLSLLKSNDGSLWIGTDGNGINRVLPDGQVKHYGSQQKGANYFECLYGQDLLEDARGNIWIGSYQNGLYVHQTKTKNFKKINTDRPNSKTSKDFRTLFKDKQNRIWVGSGMGILVYNDNLEQLAYFPFSGPSGIFGNMCDAITQTPEGDIWVSANANLFFFEENAEQLGQSSFKRIAFYSTENMGAYDYSITELIVGPKKEIWIRVYSEFLIRFNYDDYTYESLAEAPALQDIQVTAMQFDQEGYLWISSRNGIHKYHPEDGTIISFDHTDGLHGNIFVRRSSYKSSDGKLFFGSATGVNAFYPKNMRKPNLEAKLFISEIEVLNKPAQQLIGDQLKNGIQNISQLNLEANQSSFGFTYGAIANVLSTDFSYAYRLKGFNDEWIESNENRRASFTNIPAGDYIFEVKASSEKGKWNIPVKSIAIQISPYWWNSTWAYTIYIIAIILILYGIFIWIELKNKLIREEWEYAQEKELYAMKMNFFAKMSHEIQTPLTLILAPLNDMLQRAISNGNSLLEQRLSLIQNNAERLSRISNDLMTIRDKELNQLRLQVSKNNIVADLEKIALSFKDQANFKKIDFKVEFPEKEVMLWYDFDKIEHIFYNLLSNAFKFTPISGEIRFGIRQLNEQIQIYVEDSGKGIPPEELEKIFEIYYQSDMGKKAKGSGIGLALSKELIEMHHGQVTVKPSELGGTAFMVTLTTNESSFTDEEKLITVEENSLEENSHHNVNPEKDLTTITRKTDRKKLPKVLIVEDNVEMQIFLRDIFIDNYQVDLADNGQMALQSIEKKQPEIIISDVMMPIMDGISLTREIHKDKSLSHIPLILLTAKNTKESRIIGFSSGAISYIQKPFNPAELILRVHNILENKKKTENRLKSSLASDPNLGNHQSKDDEFLQKLSSVLNEQVENSNFKLEDLTQDLHMSYSVIYRKCQELTGKTLLEFFRTLKLKRAALLILEHGYRISEAAYMVGYNDSKYFTKCFKEEFGATPAAIKREKKDSSLEELLEKYQIKLF